VVVAPPPALHADVVTDVAAFNALEPEWNDLVGRAGVGHPFLTHAWLRTWWECFGASRSLCVIVVRAGDRLVAAAPMMWETAWMCGMPVRRLRLLHNDHTPRAEIIVAERHEQACRAIWRVLRDLQNEWDVVLLAPLADDSPTRQCFVGAAREDMERIGIWPSSQSPYIRHAGSWDAYFKTLPGKFRQNVRNRVARLRRDGGEPRLEILADASADPRALDDAVRLEASGWKHGAGTAIASDAAVRRFYTLLAERAAAGGWFRLLFLTVGGRRIATSYSFCYDRRLLFCKTGYDPAFDTGSPFKVLTYLAGQYAFDAGLDEIDFLGDAEPWKLEWTSTVRAHEWLYIFSNRSRARLVFPLKFRLVPAYRSAKASMWPRNAGSRN
jgi:CelD/BcsL family acetyltransferase involved in cellulose biosynthesis